MSNKGKITALVLALLYVSCFGTNTQAALNSLDVGFGVAGKVFTSPGNFEDLAYAIAIQTDAKIVVGGSVANSSNLDFGLARYNSDGSLDTSFNFNGIVVTPVGSNDDAIRALAIQADGKIIAAGYSSNGIDNDLALVRYHSDGSIDLDFGQDGIVTTSAWNGNDEITAISLGDDGSILTVGNAQGTSGHAAVLYKYQSDGSQDVSFGDQGMVFIGVGDDTIAHSLSMLGDGKIVVGGTYSDSEHTAGLLLLRYLDDGNIDTSFGDNGLAVVADEIDQAEGFGLYPAADGTIYLAGSVGTEGSRDSALFRFTESGFSDDTFGNAGVLVTPASPDDDVFISIAMNQEGLGAAGYTENDSGREFLFIYFSEQQQTYQVSAQVITTDFDHQDSMSFALAAQTDGKMIAAGYTQDGGISSFALTRYSSADTADTAASTGTTVNFIETKLITDITRVSATSGGVIQPGTGLAFTKRGVVFSIDEDPVYYDETDATTPTDSDDLDDSETDDVEGDEDLTETSSSDDPEPDVPFGSFEDKYTNKGITADGSGSGDYNSFLNNLRPGTVYYLRAYAVSSSGTVYYGNQLQLTTTDSCFIATAAYGSLLHPHVRILRSFRDKYLISNPAGKIFIELYYKYSPDIADMVRSQTWLRYLVRTVLFPIITICWLALSYGVAGVSLTFTLLLLLFVLYSRCQLMTCRDER